MLKSQNKLVCAELVCLKALSIRLAKGLTVEKGVALLANWQAGGMRVLEPSAWGSRDLGSLLGAGIISSKGH